MCICCCSSSQTVFITPTSGDSCGQRAAVCRRQLSPPASADFLKSFFCSFIISVFVFARSFSFRGPLSPGARRGVRLHAALCLRPLHPHRALGGAGGQGLHQLRQERLLGHRHLPHQALLRREGAQVSRSLCSCPLRAFIHSSHFGRRQYAQASLFISFHTFSKMHAGTV